MENRNRRTPQKSKRIPPLLLVSILPVAGMGLFILPAPCAEAQGAAQPQPPNPAVEGKIIDIIVEKNKILSSDYIITQAGVKVGDPYTQGLLDSIASRLAQTGYFGGHSTDIDDAVRVVAQQPDPTKNEFKIVITVDESDPVDRISLTGTGPIKPEDVRKLLTIKPGLPFNPYILAPMLQEVQKLYQDKGYLAVISGAGVDPQNPGVLDINIQVARVVEIVFNSPPHTKLRTKPGFMRHILKTKQGDYYNVNSLKTDQQRLFNLDIFEEATPADETIGAGKVRIVWNLTEKRTGTVTVGLGYSDRQSIVGRAELADTNFMGMGQQVSLQAETGGISGRPSAELSYTRPYIDNKNTSLSIQAYDRIVYHFADDLVNQSVSSLGTVTDTDTSGRYFEQRIGLTVVASRPISDQVRVALSIRGENVITDNIQGLSVQNASIIQNGPLFSVGASLIRNNRDLDVDPASGGFQSVNLQVGHAQLKGVTIHGTNLIDPTTGAITFTPDPSGTNLGGLTQTVGNLGNVNYLKGFIDARQYLSLQGRRKKLTDRKTVVAMRLMLGTTVGTLPFFEQYFIGGAESLRGYREDRFWGNNMALGSVELRQPIANAITAVLFTDVGDAWGGSFRNVSLAGYPQSDGFSPHLGIGAGLRVRTPLGPLRLDYGIGSEGGRFYFSIGNSF